MSLRKSPELTPALLGAARNNAQHSTGPRSPAAKQNVKLNALKHGAYVADDNRHKTMLALGEDPEQLQTLTEELMSAYGPGDALYQKQVEDLAWLYSRRDRLERVQDGLRRRALQAIDGWQHHRQQEMARVTFDSSQHVMIDVDLPDSSDRGVMLRKTISYLELVREEVKQRTFRQRQYAIKEMANLPLAPPREDDGAGTETIGEILDEDIMPEASQVVAAVEELRMNELCGNVTEKKGPGKNAELGMVNCELRKVG